MVRHRMMSFFGLAFVLLACGVVHGIDVVSLAEKCLPDNKLYKSSPGADLTLSNCTWYRLRTCCNKAGSDAVGAAGDIPGLGPPSGWAGGGTTPCLAVQNMLRCQHCSPYAATYTKICHSLCQAIHDSCPKATFSDKSGVARPMSAYKDATAFCTAFGPVLGLNGIAMDNSNCFGERTYNLWTDTNWALWFPLIVMTSTFCCCIPFLCYRLIMNEREEDEAAMKGPKRN